MLIVNSSKLVRAIPVVFMYTCSYQLAKLCIYISQNDKRLYKVKSC